MSVTLTKSQVKRSFALISIFLTISSVSNEDNMARSISATVVRVLNCLPNVVAISLKEPASSSNSSLLLIVTRLSNSFKAIRLVPSLSFLSGTILLRIWMMLSSNTTKKDRTKTRGNIFLKLAIGAKALVFDTLITTVHF